MRATSPFRTIWSMDINGKVNRITLNIINVLLVTFYVTLVSAHLWRFKVTFGTGFLSLIKIVFLMILYKAISLCKKFPRYLNLPEPVLEFY